MASNTIRFGAALDDKVSGPLDRLRTKINALQKASLSGGGKAGLLGGLAAGATLGAISAITSALGGLVDGLGQAQAAYRKDQVSQAQLQASLKANIPAYDGNATAIEAVIAKRMALGFADEEQRASLATLVTRTHDSTKALELQRLAMDLARLRGIDLASASDLVGKAYSGQVGALRRAGIAVDANATSTEALAAVQKAATGQAEAFANTSEGRVLRSQIRVGESMERIGLVVDRVSQVAIPILADAIEGIVNLWGEAIGAIERFVRANQGVFDAIGQLAALIGSVLGPAIQSVGGWIGSMFDTVNRVFQALVSVVQGVVGTIIDVVQQVVSVAAQIPGPWQAAAISMKGALADMRSGIDNWGKDITGRTGKAADDVIAGAERGGTQAPIVLAAGLAGGAGEVGSAAETMTAPIAKEVRKSRFEIADEAGQATSGLADTLRSGYDDVFSAADALKEAAKHPISTLKRIARVEGLLSSKWLARDLKSGDPLVRASAESLKTKAETELAKLKGIAATEGKQGASKYSTSLANGSGAAGKAGAKVAGAARGPLRALQAEARTWGSTVGDHFADGIRSQITNASNAAGKISTAVARILRLQSPAKEGEMSKGGGPGGWGEKFVTLWAAGAESQLGGVKDVMTRMAAGTNLAARNGTVRGYGPTASGGGGQPVIVQLNVDGRVLAEIVDRKLYYAQGRAPRSSGAG